VWWAGITEAASAAADVSAGSAGGVAARPQGGLAGPGGRSWASATLRRPGRGAAASITGQSRRGPAGIGRLAQITAATPLMLVTWSRVRAHRMNPERSATVEPLALASWLRNAKAGSPKRPCDSKERAKKVAPWLAARAFHPAPLSASPRVAAAPGINAASTQFVELVGVTVMISVQTGAQAGAGAQAGTAWITTSGRLLESATTPCTSAAHGTPAARQIRSHIWTRWLCHSCVRAQPEARLQLRGWSPKVSTIGTGGKVPGKNSEDVAWQRGHCSDSPLEG
jgi:hypothetical protein